jgi:hypothetical protein
MKTYTYTLISPETRVTTTYTTLGNVRDLYETGYSCSILIGIGTKNVVTVALQDVCTVRTWFVQLRTGRRRYVLLKELCIGTVPWKCYMVLRKKTVFADAGALRATVMFGSKDGDCIHSYSHRVLIYL